MSQGETGWDLSFWGSWRFAESMDLSLGQLDQAYGVQRYEFLVWSEVWNFDATIKREVGLADQSEDVRNITAIWSDKDLVCFQQAPYP